MQRTLWRVALASAIGTSHVSSGTPCQDFARQQILTSEGGEVLVIVVCDGAGSAAYSDIGAELATDTFMSSVALFFEEGGRVEQIDRAISSEWIKLAAGALEWRARECGHALREYACTMLAAIVGPTHAAFLQVGDGAIVVKAWNEPGWTYVFWPQHGEFANTTNFIVSQNALDALEFDLAPRSVNELAVFSDGIEKLVLHDATRSVHDAFFDAMFPPVRSSAAIGIDSKLSEGLASYLASPRICERTDDDKTLVLATRRARDREDAPECKSEQPA